MFLYCAVVIKYNFKSRLVILSIEKEGKDLYKKYKKQILRGFLGDICKEKHGQNIGAFCTNENYFIIEDGNRIYKKKNIKKNQDFCNKARVECFIYSIDWLFFPRIWIQLKTYEESWNKSSGIENRIVGDFKRFPRINFWYLEKGNYNGNY